MNKQYIDYLERIRWPKGVICPYCCSRKITRIIKENRYHCNNCFTSFSVTVGTIFHDTRLGLPMWFSAIGIILNSARPVSGRRLAKILNINKNTGCRITTRISSAMYDRKQRSLLLSIAEFVSRGELQ